MAQTMLIMSSVRASYSIDLKRESFHNLQNQILRPKLFSHLFLNPPPSANSFSSSSLSFTTLALFKTKTKDPPSKSKAKAKVDRGIFDRFGEFDFMKLKELFVGRISILAFAASLFGEAITGKGTLSQLNIKTGIPIYEAKPLFLCLFLFTVLGATIGLGDCDNFVDDPSTILDKEVIPTGTEIRPTTDLSEGGQLKKTKGDRLLMCWWVFTGLTHIIVEGYFVFSPDFLEDKTGFFLAQVWKEYSKADSRYAERDGMVVAMEGLTSILEGPASLLAVYAIATEKSYSYILQFAISLGQLYGVAVYYITAILEGDDFPATSFYYIGAIFIWTFVPSIVAIRCWRKICVAFRVQRNRTEKS